MVKSLLRVGLTAVLVGALGFFGGVKYSQSAGISAGGGYAGYGSRDASGTAGFRGGMTAGEIISADASSITVKQADGSTKTVYYSSATNIESSSEATHTDLVTGITVVASGSSESSGAITARSIQIVPKGSNLGFFGGVRGGGPGQAGQNAASQQ